MNLEVETDVSGARLMLAALVSYSAAIAAYLSVGLPAALAVFFTVAGGLILFFEFVDSWRFSPEARQASDAALRTFCELHPDTSIRNDIIVYLHDQRGYR